jgi:hypothetical protein
VGARLGSTCGTSKHHPHERKSHRLEEAMALLKKEEALLVVELQAERFLVLEQLNLGLSYGRGT